MEGGFGGSGYNQQGWFPLPPLPFFYGGGIPSTRTGGGGG